MTREALTNLLGQERAEEILKGRDSAYTWIHRQKQRPDDDLIERWYANGRTGVGAVCGKVSGNLELFEFDNRPTYEQFREAAAKTGLADAVERIE
jgi:hypothetical protein